MASSEAPEPRPPRPPGSGRVTFTVLALVLGWTWLYNVAIKGQGLVGALFTVVDTLSEDVVTGSVVTIVVGLGIVLVFTLTKLYTQVVSEAASFRMIEAMAVETVGRGDLRGFARRLLHFADEPVPEHVHPVTPGGALTGLSLLYALSWLYLVLFSEALFFVSWSAGVDLPINDDNLNLLPTLALAIPFSARVMAMLRYRYTQDYADFMPGALFVLLLVGSLGYLFESHDQKFFLLQVWADPVYLEAFLRNGLLLAFVPVFAEAVFWLGHLMLDPVVEEAEEEELAEDQA
ncbi:MAG: hypothetical protein H6732_07690 [Alphaproteobacteria bacterium]|nr:hypothetical protein [Alphaproteobacteria bacterium]